MRASPGNVRDRLRTLRQNGQPGTSARRSQAIRYAVGDVADWFEPRSSNLRVRQSVGLEEDLRLAVTHPSPPPSPKSRGSRLGRGHVRAQLTGDQVRIQAVQRDKIRMTPLLDDG